VKSFLGEAFEKVVQPLMAEEEEDETEEESDDQKSRYSYDDDWSDPSQPNLEKW